jgi:hypothetical protein
VSLPRSGAPFFELVDTAYIRLLTLMMAVLAALGVLTSVLMVTRERVHDLGVFGPLRSNRTLSGDSQPPGAEISPTSVPAQPGRPGVVTGHGQHRSRNVRYAGSGVFGPLNRGETRNGLARDVFHGQRGQLRKHYQVGQENQLDTLGIMINIIVLWQTVYIQAALDHLAAHGHHPDPADVARLSPLGHPTINLNGRYQTTSRPLTSGLRPLRGPR